MELNIKLFKQVQRRHKATTAWASGDSYSMCLFVNTSASVIGLAFLKMIILITFFVFLMRASLKVWLKHAGEQRVKAKQKKIIKDSQKRKQRKDRGTLSKNNINIENIRKCWNWFDYTQRWQLLSHWRWREKLFSAACGGKTKTQKFTMRGRQTIQDSH